jgi:hypothetical protein
MEQDTNAQPSITEVLAGFGVHVTAEGKAAAGRRLKDADERRDRPGRAAFLAQLRQPPTATA